MQMLSVRGHRIRVSVEGTGRPLLLVNGIGANLELWNPLRAHLPGRQTIAFDAPGTGRSSTPSLPLSLSEHARIALQLLDELGHSRVDVLGYSLGGAVAQELALLAPQRARRLVLAATTCGWGGVPGNPLALALLASPWRYYSPTFFRWAAPLIAGGRGARDATFLDQEPRRRAASPPSPLGYLYQLSAAMCWSSRPWVGLLRQPTLVVAGTRDHVVPVANAYLLHSLLPNASVHVVRGGGHMFLLDSPAEVGPSITGFLGSPPQAAKPASLPAASARAGSPAA